MSETYRAKCPECGETIELDSYDEADDEIECYCCGSMLVIRQMDPPRLGVIKRADDDDEENSGEDDDVDELREFDDNDYND